MIFFIHCMGVHEEVTPTDLAQSNYKCMHAASCFTSWRKRLLELWHLNNKHKKIKEIILLIMRGVVSLILCSFGFCVFFFYLVWYSVFIFDCVPLFYYAELFFKVHLRKFLLKSQELNLIKKRVARIIQGKVTYW